MITRAFILTVLGPAMFLCGAADNIGGFSASSAVVVEIDGTKVTRGDFERKRPAALFQAQNSFYEAERKALEEFVDDYLLERQAQKENVTVAQLLEHHVKSTIGHDPADESLRVYYEGLDINEPFEAARPKILEHIRQRRMARARAEYLQSLRGQVTIAVKLTPPRAQISLTDTPVRGAADAPVTLVEYADYECTFCQQVEPELDRLRSEYKEKIALAYKDLPLPMHAHAQKAAEAAQCAGLQKKYWEYHDVLFKTKDLEVPQLKAKARELGLEAKAFDECLDSGQRAEAVKATLDEAQKLGLQGTPSFFLNGRFFNGVMKYDLLRQMVEDELKRVSAPTQEAARH